MRVYVDNEDASFSRSDRTVAVRVAMLRTRGEPRIKASADQKKTLKKKADDHNKKVGNARTKRTNVRTLTAVFDRGLAAYTGNPSSVRPTVTSGSQWAFARVNSFLYVLRNGKWRGGKHDQDLLPRGHPQSSKKANQSRTTTSEESDMSTTFDIDEATIVEGDTFESKAGKSMPVEIHYRIVTPFQIEKAVQPSDKDDVKIRGAVYVGGDDMLDRHGELVEAKAIMNAWEKYSKNPVILYNHSKTYGVIGRMADVTMEEVNGVSMPMGTAIIDGGEKDITRKIRKGMLKAFSIGFIAKAAVKECKDDDSCYMKFTEIDWVETSVVDVPASPDALFSVQKSIVLGNCDCVGDCKCVETDTKGCGCGCKGEKTSEKREMSRDVFTTVEEAEKRAEEIGCEGIHSHTIDGDDGEMTVYMPCNTHDAYTDATGDELETPDNYGYYDDEDEDMKSVLHILDRLDSIERKLDSGDSVNIPLDSSDSSMTSEDMDIITEDAVATEEESAVVDAPEMVEDVAESTTEIETVAEKTVEETEEVPMPSPREALLEVASALKTIMETLDSMNEKSEVEEEVEEDEITSLKAELDALKAEKADREAEAELEAEVAKRVAEKLAEVGVDSEPARKSIPASEEKTSDVTRFDPQPHMSKGMTGLAAWLESNLTQR